VFDARDARREDFDRIAGFPQDRREAFFMHPKGTHPFSAEQLHEVALTRAIPTVVTDGDEIVGYANVYEWTEHGRCWIGNVIVNPAYRGRGAGKFLIGEMIRRARDQLKAEEVCLVCHNVNTNALPLYHKLGFKPFDMKHVKDWDGRDMAGIMMKRSAI